jgi:hypothetical protein
MHKTLTSVVALAGLAAAAGVAQAEPLTLIEEQADAVVAGDSEPMELSMSEMDGITAGQDCVFCYNAASISQYGTATATATSVYGSAYASASVSQSASVTQSINGGDD